MRAVVIAFVFASLTGAQAREPKPGWNLFSPEQDVEMGKQSAREIEATRTIVHDDAITAYLEKIGARLAQSKHAGQFRFRFHVINDPNVNAFAYPGGPVFVDSGTIAVLDNETELAAVLAHEMSHVALRHGTHQASKAILVQAPAAFAQGYLEENDSMAAKIAKLGIDFTARSIILKYSREAESEADLNGIRILSDAGYDPEGLARFFKILDAQGNQPHTRFATFLSDHPAPANRIQAIETAIEAQTRELPERTYSESNVKEFARVKKAVAGLPAPAKRSDTELGGNTH